MTNKEKTLMEKSENLKFIKIILMLTVILGHSIAFWTGKWFTNNPQISSASLALVHDWINSFHIYAFTIVSGYIFALKKCGGGTFNIYLS